MEPSAKANSEQFVEVTGGALFRISDQSGEAEGEPLPIGSTASVVGRGESCQVVVSDPQ